MSDNSIFALFALLAFVYIVVKDVLHTRTVASFTSDLRNAKSDPTLIAEMHALATEVVPVEILHKFLDTLGTGSAFVKTLTPPDVDDAIDAVDDLATAVVSGVPAVSTPTVNWTTTGTTMSNGAVTNGTTAANVTWTSYNVPPTPPSDPAPVAQ